MMDGNLKWRRMARMVGRGRIAVVDDGGAVQFVQARLGAREVQDRIPRLAEFGLSSNPPDGTDAVVLFLNGERSNGVVVATNNQAWRFKALASGEVVLYDAHGQSVYLSAAGIVVNGGGKNLTVTNTPEITLDAPLVHMTGSLMVDGNISDQAGAKGTLQHVRDNYDVHNHGNVQPGTGNTGGPSNTL